MSEHHLHPAPQDTASFQTAAQLFKYLSDPTRVRLFSATVKNASFSFPSAWKCPRPRCRTICARCARRD